MNWLKEHWEIMLGFLAIGGAYQKHQDLEKRTDKLEEALMKHIPEMREILGRIDERTKNGRD